MRDDSRLAISDGVITSYISDDQLPDEFTLREIAEDYSSNYDHNGSDDSFCICVIEDLNDGERHRFAFNGNRQFEWNTKRQYLSY